MGFGLHQHYECCILAAMSEPGKGRKVYFEVIRILAIAFVLFNHTKAFHVPFTAPLSGVEGLCCLFVSIADKVAVPLFFMVSGALLLHKEESMRKVFSKRVSRYLLLIFIFQIFQHIYAHFVLNQPVTGLSFLVDCVLARSANPAVWFLYAYLAFILLLPILRTLVKQMQHEHFLYLFALQLLTMAFAPFPETGLSKYMLICNSFFLYVLAGYYLEHRVDMARVQRKHLLLLVVLSVMCILLGMAMCQFWRMLYREELLTQKVLCFKGCLLIPCITLFLCAKKFFSRPFSPRVTRGICALGSATFTIMLCENVLRHGAGFVVHHFMDVGYMSDILTVMLAVSVGFPIGIVLKQIPGVRKLI